MRREAKASLFVVIFTLIASVVSATNQADLTCNHRSFQSEFYKLGYDSGPRFVFVNLPINETINTSVFNWQNEDGSYRLSKLIIVKKFSSWLDGAIDSITTKDSLTQNVVADVHWNVLGVGVLLPLQSDESIKVGSRVTVKDLTLYLSTTISEDDSNLY